MLSVMQQIGCDLQIWFDYKLIFAECFFAFHHDMRYLERGKKGLFASSYLRKMNGGSFTVC